MNQSIIDNHLSRTSEIRIRTVWKNDDPAAEERESGHFEPESGTFELAKESPGHYHLSTTGEEFKIEELKS